jgi:hypothetical protein
VAPRPSLFLFCAATFALAAVASFGWLLLAMGMAQCEPPEVRTRAAYLVVFALLVIRCSGRRRCVA